MQIIKINDLLALVNVIAAYDATHSDNETRQSLDSLKYRAQQELEDRGAINKVEETR